jgi:hypothetical protein
MRQGECRIGSTQTISFFCFVLNMAHRTKIDKARFQLGSNLASYVFPCLVHHYGSSQCLTSWAWWWGGVEGLFCDWITF